VKDQGNWGQEKGRPHTASAGGAELVLNILLATLVAIEIHAEVLCVLLPGGLYFLI